MLQGLNADCVHNKGTLTVRRGKSIVRESIGQVPTGKESRELSQGLCADADTIRNRGLQLRRQAHDIASDALLKAPHNETELRPRPGRNEERPKRRAAHQEMTAITNREKLLVSDAHTELQQAALSDQAADEIFSDAQTSGGQPTTNSLADTTAATETTAHDDSMTNVDVMHEMLHPTSPLRGRPISQSSTSWPRTDSLPSSLQPGSRVCTPTKPNLHCDIVTDADLADEPFQSSPESMHEQPDSPFRQLPIFPFCWGSASPVERKKQQVGCIERSFICCFVPAFLYHTKCLSNCLYVHSFIYHSSSATHSLTH